MMKLSQQLLVPRVSSLFAVVLLMMTATTMSAGFSRAISKQFLTAALLCSNDNNNEYNSFPNDANTNDNDDNGDDEYRVVQVHIVHRHGDRTPITPLKDVEYWSSELLPDGLRQKMDATTHLIRGSHKNTHSAEGKGPFGKLTKLGLFQMVQLGTSLREELVASLEKEETKHQHDDGHYFNIQKLFHEQKNPLHPNKIQVWSTDFTRTIQSVQGTLMGLFPDLEQGVKIDVDVRHTDCMIPDPQPRRFAEQRDLELKMSKDPMFQQKESELKAVREKANEIIIPLLNIDTFRGLPSFGVGSEEETAGRKKSSSLLLSWSQLSEITKCLALREKLPDGMTPELQRTIAEHTAWKWFHMYRSNDRLTHLAMHTFCHDVIIREMLNHNDNSDEQTNNESQKQLFLYSAHDSTLIGMLCALHLQQPSVWPDYGSYLKLELLVPTKGNRDSIPENAIVRCFLNDQPLRFEWCDDSEHEFAISLDLLAKKLDTVGAVKMKR